MGSVMLDWVGANSKIILEGLVCQQEVSILISWHFGTYESCERWYRAYVKQTLRSAP